MYKMLDTFVAHVSHSSCSHRYVFWPYQIHFSRSGLERNLELSGSRASPVSIKVWCTSEWVYMYISIVPM